MFKKRHRQSLGLGVIVNQRGIGLAQSPRAGDASHAYPAWH